MILFLFSLLFSTFLVCGVGTISLMESIKSVCRSVYPSILLRWFVCVDLKPFKACGLLPQVSLTKLVSTCFNLGRSKRRGRHCTEESSSPGKEAKERERDADEETAAGTRDGEKEGISKVSSL